MQCDPTRKSAGGHFLRGWRLCAIFEPADAGHCFNPAYAQQSRQTLISAGGKLGVMPETIQHATDSFIYVFTDLLLIERRK